MTQPLIEHVYELRRRLTWPVLVLLLGSILGYVWHDRLITMLSHPLGMPLYYNTPGGGFQFVLLVSLLVGMLLSLPVLLYQLIRYVEPALSTRRLTRNAVMGVMAASVGLAIAGVVFAFLIILPASLHFFAGFGDEPVRPLISAASYFSFTIGCLATFAIIFQLPLIMLLINTIHRWPPGQLPHYRMHVIIGSFAVALILPFTYDPLTQFLVALPIIGLYEVSLGLIWMANRPVRRAAQPTPKPAAKVVAPVRSAQLMKPERPAQIMPLRRRIDGRQLVQLG